MSPYFANNTNNLDNPSQIYVCTGDLLIHLCIYQLFSYWKLNFPMSLSVRPSSVGLFVIIFLNGAPRRFASLPCSCQGTNLIFILIFSPRLTQHRYSPRERLVRIVHVGKQGVQDDALRHQKECVCRCQVQFFIYIYVKRGAFYIRSLPRPSLGIFPDYQVWKKILIEDPLISVHNISDIIKHLISFNRAMFISPVQ